MPIRINTDQLKLKLRSMAKLPADARRRIFSTWASIMEGNINRRAPRGLSGSFRSHATAERGVIGSRKPWARITHFGGTIYASGSGLYRDPAPPLRSRRGSVSEVTGKPIKYLAIPIQARKNTRPRDYQNTFVFKSKKGNILIAQRSVATTKLNRKSGAHTTGHYFITRGGASQKGAKGALRILFLLKSLVRIKKQPYAGIQRSERSLLGRLIRDELKGLLRRR